MSSRGGGYSPWNKAKLPPSPSPVPKCKQMKTLNGRSAEVLEMDAECTCIFQQRQQRHAPYNRTDPSNHVLCWRCRSISCPDTVQDVQRGSPNVRVDYTCAEVNDERKEQGTHGNMPKVEKDSAKRFQPRAVWGLLDWGVAFSTLSAVARESILLSNTRGE